MHPPGRNREHRQRLRSRLLRGSRDKEEPLTRIAYFDLANGISGDMAIAAIAHAGRRLGVPAEEAIGEAIGSLGLGCAVMFVDDERGGLACLRAEVKVGAARHGAAELRTAIAGAAVDDRVRARALDALDALVGAEAVVHGTDTADVHLHELASADTAADLIGAAAGLDALGVTAVAAAEVPVPAGWMHAEHGPLPLPAPVTLELLGGALLRGTDASTELVTPSGAAVLVAHRATFGPLPALTLEATGVGAGSRIGDRPNICRVLVGRRPDGGATERLQTCVALETNIDDQTPEALGHAVERILSEGALDAWITPIVMKRSRPAFQLSVLTTPDREEHITRALFRLTTTLGIRRRTTTRWVLDREVLKVSVDGHDVGVKVGRLRGEVVNIAPEFADCVAVADRTGMPPKVVYARAAELARAQLDA